MLYIPKICDYLKILTNDEVREKIYSKLNYDFCVLVEGE